MSDQDQYLSLLTEIIAKQAVILGPEIAILKAKSVPGIVINNDGKVTGINGDASEAVKKLVDVYVDLSGQIVKNALGSVFAKYPSIKNI